MTREETTQMDRDQRRQRRAVVRTETSPQRRADEMVRMRAEGHSLQDIGDQFGVTRERARQIVRDAGGPSTAEVRAAREQARQAERHRLSRRVRRALDEHPGLTADEVAELIGVPTHDARAALGADAGRLLVYAQGVRTGASQEDLLNDLRRAAALVDGPLTVTGYDRVRARIGGRSAVRIMQVFGYWRVACDLAGITSGEPSRDEYRRRWTAQDMLRHAQDYLRTEGSRGTWEGFSDYLRHTPDAPSAATVRNAFGTWTRVKTLALTAEAARPDRNPEWAAAAA